VVVAPVCSSQKKEKKVKSRHDAIAVHPSCGSCHAAPQVSVFELCSKPSKRSIWWRERGVMSKYRLLHLH
jgi:hypothetical protein